MKAECTVNGCALPPVGRGWCRKHYTRWSKHGDPLYVKFRRSSGPDEERWQEKVSPESPGCWIWIGGLDKHGYGQYMITEAGKRRSVRAHRFIFQALVRALESTEELDHLCRVHACVNPDHVEPVTHAENNRRGYSPFAQHGRKKACPKGHPYDRVNSRGGRRCSQCENERQRRAYVPTGTANGEKTHCKYGHEFTPENTYLPRRGGRVCRECQRAKTREYMRNKRSGG